MLNINTDIESMITFLFNPNSKNYSNLPHKFKDSMRTYCYADYDQLNDKSSRGKKCGIGLLSFGLFGDAITGGLAALSTASVSNTAISAMTLFFASNPYGWAVMGALAGIAVVGIACLLLAKKSHCKNTEKTPIAIGGQFSINDDLGYKMHSA
ncbi:MAG: hypothetical protein GY782_09755 [Gammaproteobacteria bacterium]|nr:hypothetical protein [Gammaproteobacteria bacterium]